MNPPDIAALLEALPDTVDEREIIAAVAEQLLAHTPGANAVAVGANEPGERVSLALANADGVATTTAALSNPREWSSEGDAAADTAITGIGELSGPGATWLARRGVGAVLTVRAGSDPEPALVHVGWALSDGSDGHANAARDPAPPIDLALRLVPFVISRLERARQQARDHSGDPAPGPPAEAPVQPATIVLVEDESLVRDAMAALLVQHGHRVIPCARARTALELIRKGTDDIDLVVTDVVMPDMDGAALARELEHVAPELRVLFVSGFTAELTDQVREGDRRAFLQKPYTEDALLTKLAEILGS